MKGKAGGDTFWLAKGRGRRQGEKERDGPPLKGEGRGGEEGEGELDRNEKVPY